MSRYKHDLGGDVPACVDVFRKDGETFYTAVPERIVNLAKTTSIFGEWAISGEALASILGLTEQDASPVE